MELDRKSIGEFIRGFDEAFVPVLDNPRLGVRLGNSIGFSIPLLKGEVSIPDLMTIEAIKTFFPQLYHFIRNNEVYFLSTFSAGENQYRSILAPDKTQVKKAIDNHLETFGDALKTKLLMLLMDLFPQLKTIYQNYMYHEDIYMGWHRGKRICSPQYFSRYFSYVVQKDDISDVFFAELLEGLDTLPQEELKAKFSQRFSMVSVSDLIFKFRNWERQLPPKAAIPLAKVLASLGEKFAAHDQAFLKASTFGIAAYFIARLIKNLPGNQMINTALEVMNCASPLSFCFEIEQSLTDSHPQILDENKLSDSDIGAIRKLLVGKVKEKLKEDDWFYTTDEVDLQTIVYWWFTYDNIGELKQYIEMKMQNEADWSFRLLKAFTPTIISFRSGSSEKTVMKSDFSINTYVNISQIVDPSILLTDLESAFGAIRPADKIPALRTSLSDADIRSVFKKIHLKALSNEITLPEPWANDVTNEGEE